MIVKKKIFCLFCLLLSANCANVPGFYYKKKEVFGFMSDKRKWGGSIFDNREYGNI